MEVQSWNPAKTSTRKNTRVAWALEARIAPDSTSSNSYEGQPGNQGG
jgi:hypothetical protein